jgi:hypothetical protein
VTRAYVTADLDLIALRGTADLCFAHDFNKLLPGSAAASR